MDVEEVAKLWADYQTTKSEEQPVGDVSMRNRLVTYYMPLVNRLADHMVTKYRHAIPADEFRSSGYVGLMEAVEGFNPERGYQFNTYAPNYIRGRMVDYVRETDYVPRLVRREVAAVEQTEATLTQSLGRRPDDMELLDAVAMTPVAQRSGATPRAVLSEYHLLATHARKSLDAEIYENNSRKVLVGDVVSSDEPDPGDSSYYDFEHLLQGLTEDEKLIIILYYREEFTMKAIGAIMGLSESRISQTHDDIIKRLKCRFGTRRRCG